MDPNQTSDDKNNGDQPPTSLADDPIISDLISITIKTIDSKNYQFQVENDIQIKAFKEKIAPTVEIEPESQRMIFCGRVLADDKTLKDYRIDNDKVIHLVKRTPPAKTETPNNSNDNQSRNNQSRFRSFRNDDGSVLMGTFSMEPSTNLFNQLMRQIFSNRFGSNGTDNSDASSNGRNFSNIRPRFNRIRQLLRYIETNFQILQDPSHFPTSQTVNAFDENHQITINDYVNCFQDTLSYLDRLKPYLNDYLQTLNQARSSNNNNNNNNNNQSIIMRIVHHLSHVLHSLTDFSIDSNNTSSPIRVNVLENQSNSNPLNINTPTAETSSSTENNAAPNENNQNNTDNSSESNTNNTVQPQTSNSSTPMTTTPTEVANPLPRSLGSFPSGVFVTQSPILLMEVDATINGHRTNLGTRSIPNFSISDLNVTINNLIHNANNVSFNTLNPGNLTTNSSSTTNSNGTPIVSNENTSTTPLESNVNNNQANPETQSSQQQPQNVNTTSNNNDANINPLQNFSIGFDPFLNCNSRYTLPEIRSTTNLDTITIPFRANTFPESFNQVFDTLNQHNAMLSNLMNLLENISPNEPWQERNEFFDFIGFLLDRFSQASFTNFGENNTNPSFRINDYLRILNLFDSVNDSFFSNMMSSLFQNLDFEDLYQLLNFNFQDFSRLREPLQTSIQNSLLNGREWTTENIRNEIENVLACNETILNNITADLRSIPGVDVQQSLRNFVKETLVNFLNKIMQATNDETFGNDLVSTVKYIVSAYIHFCRACFEDPGQARNALIANFFAGHNEFNTRILTFMSNMISERINAFANNLENDNSLINEINNYIVRTPASQTANVDDRQQEQPQPMESSSEPDVGPSNMYDSNEEIEFADASSEMPSTSHHNIQQIDSNEQQTPTEWQTVVPNDWVPIIKEDINKQKNMDNDHQPPFSDAYLSGMSKKRRLEHDNQSKQK